MPFLLRNTTLVGLVLTISTWGCTGGGPTASEAGSAIKSYLERRMLDSSSSGSLAPSVIEKIAVKGCRPGTEEAHECLAVVETSTLGKRSRSFTTATFTLTKSKFGWVATDNPTARGLHD